MSAYSPVSTPSPSESPDLAAEEEISAAEAQMMAATALPLPPAGTNFDTEFPEEDYVMVKKVGTGSFGNVWKAIHTPSNSIVAVKKVCCFSASSHISLYMRDIEI